MRYTVLVRKHLIRAPETEHPSQRLKLLAEMFDELRWMNGLRQKFESVTAFFGALEDLDRGSLAAEKNDARVGTEIANGDGGFDAVDMRHQNVRQQKVRATTPGDLYRFRARVCRLGDEAVAVENLHDGVGDKSFIVDDENAGKGSVVLRVICRISSWPEQRFERVTAEQKGVHEGIGSWQVSL